MAERAIVVGATGLTGGLLVEALVRDPHFQTIVCPVRRPGPRGVGVEAIEVDFGDEIGLKRVMRGDVLFFCFGSTRKKAGGAAAFEALETEFSSRVFRAAKASGVRRVFMISSVGASDRGLSVYLRTKRRVECLAEAEGFDQLVVFRPSLIIGQRGESRLLERLATRASQPFLHAFVGPLRKYRPVSARAIAAAMIAKATDVGSGVEVVDSDVIYELGRSA